MNALQSYSSDDEPVTDIAHTKMNKPIDFATNYDDVGMDISEDSGDDGDPHHSRQQRRSDKGGSCGKGNNNNDDGGDFREQGQQRRSDRSGNSYGQTNNIKDDGSNINDLGSKSIKDQESPSNQRSSDCNFSLQERLMGLASGNVPPTVTNNSNSSGSNSSSSNKNQRRSNDDRRGSHSSDDRSSSHSHRRRSKSRSRERNSSNRGGSGRGSRDSRDDKKGSSSSSSNSNRHRHEERRKRSRSRSRERRRSRSRDRKSRSKSRERRRRSRSHSKERKRLVDLRKEAQMKLAALQTTNPELTGAELLKRSLEAQVEEVQKKTGVRLPAYYNPATMNPTKFAEQERKKKLLWGNKAAQDKPDVPPPSSPQISFTPAGNMANRVTTVPGISPPLPDPLAIGGQANLWAQTKFTNDNDGKVAEKFRRLMGVKHGGGGPPPPLPLPLAPATSFRNYPTGILKGHNMVINSGGRGGGSSSGSSHEVVNPVNARTTDQLQRQESMFNNMEKQYEVARIATHTHKGFGLGFTSQSFVPK